MAVSEARAEMLRAETGALVGQPGRKLRVCVLHPSAEGTAGPFTGDVDPSCKPDAYDTEGRYEWGSAFLRKATCSRQLVDLVSSGRYDVFLNLCDGAWDEDRAGKDVVEALERLNVPYTGANAAFYEPSKVDMKMDAFYYGVRVPAWVHVEGGPGREASGVAAVLGQLAAGGLRYPLIVKHPSGYGSVSMSRDCKVADEAALRQQVSHFVSLYGGALVEQFIPGREFTVLVVEEAAAAVEPAAAGAAAAGECAGAGAGAEPEAPSLRAVGYTPVECVFGAGEDFKHFDLKWTDYESMRWQPCGEPALAEALKAAARDTFLATRGVSYGRCDFRVDSEGHVFLLEINPNCGVLYPPGLHGSADYILTLDPHHDHRHFISSILASAIARHRCRQPLVAPSFIHARAPGHGRPAAAANGDGHSNGNEHSNGTGHGTAAAGGAGAGAQGSWALAALRDIRAGSVVQRGELRPHTLVSGAWVQRSWPKGSRERAWFEAFATAVGPEVWATRPVDASRWAPLTHSPDPNCRMEGLDVVARRYIAAGEAITVDMGAQVGHGGGSSGQGAAGGL